MIEISSDLSRKSLVLFGYLGLTSANFLGNLRKVVGNPRNLARNLVSSMFMYCGNFMM